VWILAIVVGVLPVLIHLGMGSNDASINTTESLPSRNLTPFEQQAQALAGLLIKPLYSIVSLAIILSLIGQRSPDILALQWGQIAFFAGETFCAINFYIYKHDSILSEYLHSYGMALAFALTSFAILEGFDSRVLRLTVSKSACAALTVCGRCTRHEWEGCKARTIARFTIPVLGVLIFIPLLSPLQPDAYGVSIFGFPYSYTRFDVYEIYERRVLPLVALISFLIAWISLWRKSEPPIPLVSKVFFCAGVGALGFSFFRLTLNAVFIDNLVWFEFWEEATELLFVAATAFVLWQFRKTLLVDTPVLQKVGHYFN
jgi:hypothetical protein